jgi:hypothetical protein
MSPPFEAKINKPSKLVKDNVKKIGKGGGSKPCMTNGFLIYD